MATIDNRTAIDAIIAGNGWSTPAWADDGEPPVVQITEYTNAGGKVCWGVSFANEGLWGCLRYLEETEYVRNPKVIWTRQETHATENAGQ